MFEPAASARTVVPLNSGTLVEMTVSESCLAVRADCVAYVELMSTPATWSAVAFTVAKFVVAEKSWHPLSSESLLASYTLSRCRCR
jgi:uncharacterized protein YerC